MNVQHLIDEVRANSGVTVDINTGDMVADGFIVATEGNTLSVPYTGFVGEDGQSIVSSYIDAHRAALSSTGRHLGVWHDVDNSMIVLDVVERVRMREEVIELAIERNQRAIYDVDNGVVIEARPESITDNSR